MKKLKIFSVILLAVLMLTGCSCTSSMCTEEDLNNIQTSIREKWENNEDYKEDLRNEAILKDKTDEAEIQEYIRQNVEKKIEKEYENHPKACLTTTELEDPSTGVKISGKSWKDAFNQGLLEGLIVYPISCLLIFLTKLFGGKGFSQVLSIIVTTIIIRSLMLIVTFKSQVQQQKLQSIQAEMVELSNKLKDPNISQNEKQRLSMKMMEIYQKNGINPISSLITPFVSLPIFLSVWSAVNQTLVIRTGVFAGLDLGVAVSTQIFEFNIGAILLFLLMAGGQILSMKLPMIIRKKQATYKNRDKIEQANKQGSGMMIFMMVMVIVTGFVLPAALAIYWTVGSVFSIVQTLIFQNPKVKVKIDNFINRKKKAKVVQ